MREDRILESFLEQLKKHFGKRLQKVILFGSQARKDRTAESDYDLLLIFKEVDDEVENYVEELASEILLEYGKLLSTFCLTSEQLDQMRFEPFIMNAQKEGVLL